MRTEQMNRYQLLRYIDMVSFQVVDTQLFLDTHPDDVEALKHFKHYKELRKEALDVYAQKYGPLTIDCAQPSTSWCWVQQPWPWEGGNC